MAESHPNTLDFPYRYRAKLRRVVDGDTVDLITDLTHRINAHIRYRLLGVDTPELRSRDLVERKKAREAKDFVIAELTFAATRYPGEWPFVIETEKADSFGRWLCRLHYMKDDGSWTDLSTELVRAGLAIVRLN